MGRPKDFCRTNQDIRFRSFSYHLTCKSLDYQCFKIAFLIASKQLACCILYKQEQLFVNFAGRLPYNIHHFLGILRFSLGLLSFHYILASIIADSISRLVLSLYLDVNGSKSTSTENIATGKSLARNQIFSIYRRALYIATCLTGLICAF